ncbi:MAG: dTMP kinase [bacterium]
MQDKKGLFITFEGADGSGKTTQLNLTAEYFKKNNIDFITTRDPGGTQLGIRIRDILLNYQGKIFPFCELFLYLADRSQHIEEKIIPALNMGNLVFCDRYIDSTLAYQGYARGLDIHKIMDLNDLVTHSLMPDLTLLFDIDTKTAMSRLGNNKDRLESEAINFHQKVREGYLDLAKKYPQRIRLINANRQINDIHQEVIQILLKILPNE